MAGFDNDSFKKIRQVFGLKPKDSRHGDLMDEEEAERRRRFKETLDYLSPAQIYGGQNQPPK